MKQHPIPEGSLYFLWHPGTENIFSGYGLTIQADCQERLVGLLMVDRPHPVEPAWLVDLLAAFGGYQLHTMTATGERGLVCQMWVEPDSRTYLRQLGLVQKVSAEMITQALVPLLKQLPKPRLKVGWDERLQLWTSEFQEQSLGLTTPAIVTKERSKMNGQTPKQALFSLGQVVATPGALEALEQAGQRPEEFLSRHLTGDWGELDEFDHQQNEVALKEGNRLLSAYETGKEARIWVITEWDRSVTTLLLPEEY